MSTTRTATATGLRCAARVTLSRGRRSEHYFGAPWRGVVLCTFCEQPPA